MEHFSDDNADIQPVERGALRQSSARSFFSLCLGNPQHPAQPLSPGQYSADHRLFGWTKGFEHEKSVLALHLFYTGHPGGTEEMDLVLAYVKELDKKEFDVLEIKHINGIKTAPFLLIIYKKGE